MSRVHFDVRHTVAPEEVDEQGHVHNLRYIQWSLWAAGRHTRSLGHDAAAELDRGFGFVVRDHQATYRRAAFAGDAIVARTWIERLDDHSAHRRTLILRDDQRLADIRTRWVYIDLREHRLSVIPEAVRAAVVTP